MDILVACLFVLNSQALLRLPVLPIYLSSEANFLLIFLLKLRLLWCLSCSVITAWLNLLIWLDFIEIQIFYIY